MIGWITTGILRSKSALNTASIRVSIYPLRVLMEHSRIEATTAKKKKAAASSAEPADHFEDIYLEAFHVEALFEILRDPFQLDAWWRKRKQGGEKLMSDANCCFLEKGCC